MSDNEEYSEVSPAQEENPAENEAQSQNEIVEVPNAAPQAYPYPLAPASAYYYNIYNSPNQPSPAYVEATASSAFLVEGQPALSQSVPLLPYAPTNTNNTYYDYDAAGSHFQPASPQPKRGFWSHTLNRVLTTTAAALLFVMAMAFFLVSNHGGSSVAVASDPAAATISVVKVAASTTQTSSPALTVAQVSAKVRPAIVQITTSSNSTTNSAFGSSGTSQATGVGSGVIYDATGYILTNFHVIDGADSLLVTLPDGRSFDGTVVGSDQQTDLAIVKIDPKGATLPVAQLGDSSTLQVGDGLVAIGNALALPGGPTVTAGVVSALNRSVTEPSTQSTGNAAFGNSATSSGPQLYSLIQTDAAINPGNSGGALVNMQGQVIGINTLAAGQAEPGVQAEGIGFAISINQAKQVITQLVASGKVSHPYLGIAYQPLTPALANQLQLTGTNQTEAVLMQVQSGSPAAQAGLKTGDVIIAVDGQKLDSKSALGQIINSHKVGDKLELQVITPQANGGNNVAHTVEITLVERTTTNG